MLLKSIFLSLSTHIYVYTREVKTKLDSFSENYSLYTILHCIQCVIMLIMYRTDCNVVVNMIQRIYF